MLRPWPESRPAPTTTRGLVALVIAIAWLATSAHWWQEADRGFDERSSSSWREADYASITRGFASTGLDPLNARVPWRGDSSGEVEMELPVAPLLAAAIGRTVGFRDSLLRQVSTVFAAGACALFGWLALSRLTPLAALLAWLFFVSNPIVQMMATAMQPEAVMLFFTVLAVHAALRWHASGSPRWWWLAVAAVSLALLAKSSTVYLLPFCALLVWLREGPRGLLAPRSLLALGLALAAPLLWYGQAYATYLRTGLSLGLSNETHLISLAVLADPWPAILGNLVHEARFVAASLAGAVLCLLGLRVRAQAPVLCLAGSVALFYAAISETSGQGWAWYYHLHSVVPVSLLVGAGAQWLGEAGRNAGRLPAAAVPAVLAVLCGWALAGNLDGTRQLRAQRDHASPVFMNCVLELAGKMPPDARLLVRGGTSRDEHGHRMAYDEPMAFAWANRLGATFPSNTTDDPFASYLDRQPPWFWLRRVDDAQTIVDYPRLARRAAGFPVLARCAAEPGYSLVRLTSD
jgi:hypothetical protein